MAGAGTGAGGAACGGGAAAVSEETLRCGATGADDSGLARATCAGSAARVGICGSFFTGSGDGAEHLRTLARGGYASLTRNLIDPIEKSYKTILAIGTAIALECGAHG